MAWCHMVPGHLLSVQILSLEVSRRTASIDKQLIHRFPRKIILKIHFPNMFLWLIQNIYTTQHGLRCPLNCISTLFHVMVCCYLETLSWPQTIFTRITNASWRHQGLMNQQKWQWYELFPVIFISQWWNQAPVSIALTHLGRDKTDAISQMIFSSAFSWMKMFECRLRFHWRLFLRVLLTIFQHWFR